MFSEAECGFCYQTYNAGSRCPRQLSCKHTFCERCLVTLARSAERPEPGTLCPLCRHFTSLSEATIKDKLPVDDDILERLVKAGCFDECADEDEEPNEDLSNQRKEKSLPTPRGRLVRSVRRLCKKTDRRQSKKLYDCRRFEGPGNDDLLHDVIKTNQWIHVGK